MNISQTLKSFWNLKFQLNAIILKLQTDSFLSWWFPGATTLSITTFSITTLSAKGLVNDTQHDTQRNNALLFAECRYAECRILLSITLTVIMLSAIKLSVVMLSVVMQRVLALIPYLSFITKPIIEN